MDRRHGCICSAGRNTRQRKRKRGDAKHTTDSAAGRGAGGGGLRDVGFDDIHYLPRGHV